MYEEETRFLEQNICNLGYAQYESSNEWGIPDLLPCHIDNLKDIPIQGFNFALTDKHPEGKGVHFFIHDYQFERIWQRPVRYTEFLKKFSFCLTPTFSTYLDMPYTHKSLPQAVHFAKALHVLRHKSLLFASCFQYYLSVETSHETLL